MPNKIKREKSFPQRVQKKHIRKGKQNLALTPKQKVMPTVHPWRICPYGEHWVRTHPMRIPPSQSHPEGIITTRHEHCARNPSGQDQLYSDEIAEIVARNFSDLKNKPCPLPSEFGTRGSVYDDLIAGWVQYWNEVLMPEESLESNLVKALIASESGFDPLKLSNSKDSNSARGLTQITNETRKLLSGAKGGLKDHLITPTRKDLNDPSVNICAGVRWLFEKRCLASSILKKPASWIDAIWEYKGLRKAKQNAREDIKSIFNKYYREYQKCGKK